MKTDVSVSTIKRLPIYLHYLRSLPKEEHATISATQIASALSFGDVQVRKDLASVSDGGKPKVGYEVKDLIARLESYLGVNEENNAVLIGAGRLGQALMHYRGFAEFGLEILAGFDNNPKLFGMQIGSKPILPFSELEAYIAAHGVVMGILTVPAHQAQTVADTLVKLGVRAIWNFSPAHIVVPDTVVVKNENLAASLAVLSKQLQQKK